jgi:predicted aminopeptidase
VAAVASTARVLGRIAAAGFGVVVAGVAVALLVSADARYIARAAVEEALILARRRAIASVVADASTDPVTRAKLRLVLAARDFAADSLGLAARETYTTYTRVRRDTLVLVLTASRADRLLEYTWTYPVVGRVPYKGFFSRRAALAAARALARRGYDTYLRVSDAFSTLGWFNDPLLSTIVGEDSVDLAATVIHEILHNTVWVPGHVPFNESLADFVGYRGAEALFRSRGDLVNAARAAARWQDEIRLSHFYDTLAVRLRRLYGSSLPRAAVLERRAEIFREARDALAGPVGGTLQTIDGRALARRPLNNAVVIAQRLYRTRLGTFEQLLREHGGDLRRTVADVRRRVAGASDPWAALAPHSGARAAGAGAVAQTSGGGDWRTRQRASGWRARAVISSRASGSATVRSSASAAA